MKNIKQTHFNEERALFSSADLEIEECIFSDGESPLKESRNLIISDSEFQWKYPLWYCKDVTLKESEITETGRSGIWYTDNISVSRTTIYAPKTFRYSSRITLSEVSFKQGDETLWNCKDIKLHSVNTVGDYFGFHSENIDADNIFVQGNYLFDSCKNVTVRNSRIESKDSFWNCENVTLINCTIIGEYLGWNTKNLTLINCYIESHQALCYVDGLKMYNCVVIKSDLILEYSRGLDVEITSVVDSIKNPHDGKIAVAGVKELILDKKYINPRLVKIIRR